jgi:translation initiation factor IF-3
MIKIDSPIAGSGEQPDPDQQVRLIDLSGKQLGIMAYSQASALAVSQQVRLVCIAPAAKPPICRLLPRRREEEAK